MTERTALRAASPSDKLVFHDRHEPLLKADDYDLTIRQDLEITDKAKASAEAVLKLRVSGPQLTLPPGTVATSFPAHLASGRFDTVLPHVVVSDHMLPWQRLPEAGGATGNPWLVLLVLSAAELARQDVGVATMEAKDAPGAIVRTDAAADDKITVLTLPRAMANDLMPPLDDLRWLVHIRQMADGPETATILASRLPEAGAENHAFLVDVEHRYGGQGLAGRGPVALPVLHRFSFTTEPAHVHGFIELLTEPAGQAASTALPFTLGKAPAESPESQSRLDDGMIPVVHQMRNGDRSAAWYHGPLLPGAPPVDAGAVHDRLPADHADRLMVLDREFAMFDVSYAAAWELGRLLALENTDRARALYQWKRGMAHHLHMQGITSLQAAQVDNRDHPGLAPAAMASLPAADPLPPIVADWLQHGLMELRDVPFRYLVPDEALLPPRGLRFFDVDHLWVEALRDGAFSVGRTDSRARVLEMAMRAHLPHPKPMSGILLRSSAVADFPHLEVEGYAEVPPAPGTFTGNALPIVRFERLSKSVLIVLFEGRVRAVDLHLHPQAVHFGFVLGDGSQKGREIFEKDGPTGPVRIGYTGSGPDPTGMTAGRRVDMAALAKAMGMQSGAQDGRVARFAKAMLDGVPLVRFTRDPGDGGTV